MEFNKKHGSHRKPLKRIHDIEATKVAEQPADYHVDTKEKLSADDIRALIEKLEAEMRKLQLKLLSLRRLPT